MGRVPWGGVEAVEVGGIELEVGMAAALQGAAQERLHLRIDLLTDATHLRVGDAALGGQGTMQRPVFRMSASLDNIF